MPNGSAKCWAEFKGWLKAFTPLESLLTLLEAILLVLFLLMLIFVIIHFLTCRGGSTSSDTTATTTVRMEPESEEDEGPATKKPRVTCTYTPQPITTTLSDTRGVPDRTNVVTVDPREHFAVSTHSFVEDDHGVISPDETDGELADDDEKDVVMALVKVKPGGVTFGCILTVVSHYWTVTAASCIESIEEVDSLDNFVMLDNYGESTAGRSHAVTDVRVHPFYEGRNNSFDLALLKSEDRLKRRRVRLPSLLDNFKMTVGERAEILGFGHFRLIDQSALGKRVHSATVHVLPVKHCSPPEFAERLLLPIEPVTHGRCGVAPMCLGVLYSRGTPCNYCAGTPLMRGTTLIGLKERSHCYKFCNQKMQELSLDWFYTGVMADNDQCGAACEPSLYANIAAARGWLAQVIAS